MVNGAWLQKVRHKNRERFGMEGLGYVSSQDLVSAINREREVRTASIHGGRFERTDPTLPEPGSVESIVRSLAPPQAAPARAPVPRSVAYLGGAVALGLVGLIAFMALRRN